MADCNDLGQLIKEGLQALAAAMPSSVGGGTGGGGGTGCYPNVPIGDCLPDIPNDDWLPPEGDEEKPNGPPPDGYDTWEEFYVYKCQAANYVWWSLYSIFNALASLGGRAITAAEIVPVLNALRLALIFTPIVLIPFISNIVQIAITSLLGLYSATGAAQYMKDNKQDIICALYESGSSAEAIDSLAVFIENAIEAGVAGVELGELGPIVASLFGEAFSLINNANLVKPLFHVFADILLPDAANCDGCEQEQPGDVIIQSRCTVCYSEMLVGQDLSYIEGNCPSGPVGWFDEGHPIQLRGEIPASGDYNFSLDCYVRAYPEVPGNLEIQITLHQEISEYVSAIYELIPGQFVHINITDNYNSAVSGPIDVYLDDPNPGGGRVNIHCFYLSMWLAE
jgi:hypothetical protein